jgi:hypothetical protein
MAAKAKFANPYRPGAGHMPVYLAGRQLELDKFARLLGQDAIFSNLIVTGLRGVGKTVLLETFKPTAIKRKWLWVGTDLSEAASLSEGNIALRLLADLALVTSTIVVGQEEKARIGFRPGGRREITLNFETLTAIYSNTPGLVADKLKTVLEVVWQAMQRRGVGIVFSYDEAQNMSDHSAKEQYPLSLMLDVFQSIQKKAIPFMLVLAGLPTLFPKLVEARTFSERMFHIMTLDRLSEKESRDAILKPLDQARGPVKFSATGIQAIVAASGGYPYFIQFICRELYDAYLQNGKAMPVAEATRKLDADFFIGRWSRATDRQRQLLWVVANLGHADAQFSVQEVVVKSHELLDRGFSASQISQTFQRLSDVGLIFKNRHGRYSFAVPLMGQFILRQADLDRAWLK